VKTLFIEPGSPWEDGYIESFNGEFPDELLNGEFFDTLLEAKVLIEQRRREYNMIRPHSALGHCPTSETIQPWFFASAMLQRETTVKILKTLN
jgi:transposase InsO family protein